MPVLTTVHGLISGDVVQDGGVLTSNVECHLTRFPSASSLGTAITTIAHWLGPAGTTLMHLIS